MHEYNKVAICLFRTLLLAQFLFEQVSTDGCTGWVKAKRTGGPGNTVLVIIYGNALAGGSLHGTGRNTTRYATQSLSHRYHCCRARLVASINIGLSPRIIRIGGHRPRTRSQRGGRRPRGPKPSQTGPRPLDAKVVERPKTLIRSSLALHRAPTTENFIVTIATTLLALRRPIAEQSRFVRRDEWAKAAAMFVSSTRADMRREGAHWPPTLARHPSRSGVVLFLALIPVC
ncbi:hypothetical protein J6590_007275 [Homalodisca vitripennis]|nr:hypothetical protein J6590_007275 [Homalodisca vitripennis]